MSIIRLFLFHILLSIRGIILGISKLLALMLLVTWFATLYVKEMSGVPFAAKLMLVIFGIAFTFVNWFYDDLIFYLKPKNHDLILYK